MKLQVGPVPLKAVNKGDSENVASNVWPAVRGQFMMARPHSIHNERHKEAGYTPC